MRLIVAEKPAVARAICPAVGARKKQEGYFEGGGWLVSWCYGHLAEMPYPDQIKPEWAGKWDLSQLPMIPEEWQLRVRDDAREQFGVLKKLMTSPDVDEIICATDADREGECIFRYVYGLAGCAKPVSRLWVSSLEEDAIREGFSRLKPDKEYDRLFQAGFCRAKADWLLGMNASRLFSVCYHARLNIGRVQTPTLAMVAQRDRDVKGFVRQKYYTVELEFPSFSASSARIDSEPDAERMRMACGNTEAKVASYEAARKTENPPKPYDLTTLQREANKELGLTAKETLDALQALYEAKLATYPRTDSRYISNDMQETAARAARAAYMAFPSLGNPEENGIDLSGCTDDSKVTGHHAILPTEGIAKADLSRLSSDQAAVLLMISAKLAQASGKPHRYVQQKAVLMCGGCEFTAAGRTTEQEGWKATLAAFRRTAKKADDPEEGEDEERQQISELTPGSLLTHKGAAVKEHLTSSPKPYTEDTLLSAMERAGAASFDEDTEKKGLGTPATRASTIESLVANGYLVRNGKRLSATEKGKSLIAVVPEEVRSPEMTAEWENKLLQIEKGEYASEAFMSEITGYVVGIVNRYSRPSEGTSFHRDDAIGRCPNCGSDVIEGKYGPMCVGKCGMYPGKLYGQDLTLAQVKKLLSGKKVACTINGRKTTVLPETVKRTFGGKTYCNWKTESAAPEKEGAAAIRKKGAAR